MAFLSCRVCELVCNLWEMQELDSGRMVLQRGIWVMRLSELVTRM
jgi:hypothetical protein